VRVLNNKSLIYGLDSKVNQLKKHCSLFLDGEKEFQSAVNKLSITPTFLFYGLPGTGKTTTAIEVYNQLKKDHNIDLEHLRIDQLISYNFGESSKNLINFFDDLKVQCEKNDSYVYVVIDELDSFTTNRYQNDSESIKRILLTFNNIIDELFLTDYQNRFILVATTNMIENIDTAILRRFFFHEDFDIRLSKESFYEFLNEISFISPLLEIENDEDKNKLFNMYQDKKQTLGELKRIFAKQYLNLSIDIKTGTKKLDLTRFEEEKSTYEIILNQKPEVKNV